jgi:hypothetical protein
MSDKKITPIAFPTPCYNEVTGQMNGYSNGMTLLDYFAAKAMQGLTSTLDGDVQFVYYDKIAQDAYLIAEAMLRERDNGST